MKYPSRLVRAGLSLGLVTLTASTSCVEAQELLLIERPIWWTGGAGDCTLTGTENPPLRMPLDVYFQSDFGMGFVVTNHRLNNPGSNTALADDTEIVIDYAEVNLAFSGGALDVAAFEYQLPTNSVRGGESTVIVVKLPPEVAASLNATMAALPAGTVETLNMEVILHARNIGRPGSNARLGEIVTRPFIMPLEICYECLALCVDAEDCGGEMGDPPVCPTPTSFAGTCGFAQWDAVVAPGCSAPE